MELGLIAGIAFIVILAGLLLWFTGWGGLGDGAIVVGGVALIIACFAVLPLGLMWSWNQIADGHDFDHITYEEAILILCITYTLGIVARGFNTKRK